MDETFKGMVAQFRRESTTLREFIYCGDGETPEGMHGYEALVAQTAPAADALRRGNDLAGIFLYRRHHGLPQGRC